MTPLWTREAALAATGGQAQGSDWQATGVSIDTRTLKPGDLFVALKDVRDGHDFVAAALEKGAAAALVTHRPEGVAADAPLLIVDDVLRALEALGKAARARTQAQVIAVTGSAGKTSTKEMLLHVLSKQGRTHAAEASYNNHWGVPLTLARMPADTEFAVIEIGMSHPGEIAPLSRLARPHVAMVTTVAPAHLEAFESVEGIAREKASILEGIEPGGTAVMNADVPTAPILKAAAIAKNARYQGFGESDGAHYRLRACEIGSHATTAIANANGAPIRYTIAAAGRHFAMNGLGALAVSDLFGCDRDRAIDALANWTPVKGRGERQRLQLNANPDSFIELIDDSYNANPASMAASLDVLGAADGARRIAIIGDMKELGPDGPDLHAWLADTDAMNAIAKVHCVGPLMRHLWEALPSYKRGHWSETSDDMARKIAGDLPAEVPRDIVPGDVVLIKGSLSMKLALVVDAIRKMGHDAPQ